MDVLSQDRKLLTLSLLLRTMPKTQQSLLMSHFSPEVVRRLTQIEQQSAVDVEKLDWTPFYQSWTELQKILNDCREEIKIQRLLQFAEEQRPKLKEYILLRLGRQKKGPPVFLSQEIMKSVDNFLEMLSKS